MNDLELARFMAKIEVLPNGCWRWTGATGGSGIHRYGVFQANGKLRLAHRVSFGHFVGGLVEGNRKVTLDHTCPNGPMKLCVNWKHLEQVSHGVNLQRSKLTLNAINAAKTHCDHGHEFTPENTYITKDSKRRKGGHRSCRTCKRDWARRNR